jgi:hypothetical protein
MIPGYCSPETDTDWNGKRDFGVYDASVSSDLHSSLEKRAVTTYNAVLYTGTLVVVIAASFPPIGRLFEIANRNQVLKQAFRMIPGYCLGPSIQEIAITLGSAGALVGLQAEHPIDVSTPIENNPHQSDFCISDKL